MTADSGRIAEPLLTAGFVTLWVVGFLQEMSFGLLVHLPGYMTTLGATEAGIGVVYAAGALVALLLRPAMGRIIDTWGRRRAILAASAVFVAALVGYIPLTRYGPALFVVHIGFTSAEIFLFTAVLTLATDILPASRRTQGLALLGISGLLPIGLGSITGDLVLGDGQEFSRLFLIAAILGTVAWALSWRLPEPRLDEDERATRRGFGRVVAQRDLGPVWLATFVFAVAITVLFTYLRTFIDSVDFGSVGLYLGVYSAVAVVVRVAMSRSLGAIHPMWLVVPGIAAIAAQFGILAVTGSVTALVIAGAIGGLGHGLMFPVLSTLVADRAVVAERGTAFAVFSGIFDAVVLVVAPAVGVLIEVFGYDTGFAAVAATIVVGFVGFVVWERAAHRPSPRAV